MPDNGSLVKRSAALSLAALFAAGAAWRAVVSLNHYRASLAATDDPSIQELEQVSAFIEGGLALLLVAHGGALFTLSRRSVRFRGPYALVVAGLCAFAVGLSLLGMPPFSLPGVYAAFIVVGVAVLSQFLLFSWLSVYLGALLGSALAWLAITPTLDPVAGLFVVGPCVIFALLGATLRGLIMRLTRTARSGRGQSSQ